MNLKQFFCAFFCTFCLFIGTVAAQSGGGITLSLKDVSLQEAMQRVQKVSDYIKYMTKIYILLIVM